LVRAVWSGLGGAGGVALDEGVGVLGGLTGPDCWYWAYTNSWPPDGAPGGDGGGGGGLYGPLENVAGWLLCGPLNVKYVGPWFEMFQPDGK
jgi:hypothetical protein